MAPPESERLTASKAETSEWYAQVLPLAGIIDKRFESKGTFVWRGYGYKMMMLLKRFWDEMYQESGIEEVYFPLIVPVKYAEQNESWWEGFKSEGYKLIAGSENEVQGVVRPTGEPAMYPMFKLWTRTHADLPIRIYQTVNSYRYETKHTRPLIRDREITVWHEIHTAHATKEEAEEEMKLHRKFYDKIWEEMLALPAWPVWKPAWELFPGAESAIEYYNITPTGRVMENGSVNFLGQAYAKKFDITYTDADGNKHHAWQMCTGNGARYLAAAFLVHGDDNGLIVPPRIAPIQAVIVPIYKDENNEEIVSAAQKLAGQLSVRTHVDDRDKTPGSKFFDWEIKGVPLRIELGPRDIKAGQAVLVRRDTGDKQAVALDDVAQTVKKLLETIHEELLSAARKDLQERIVETADKQAITGIIDESKVALVPWCGQESCNDELVKLAEGLEGFGTAVEETGEAECAVCGKPGKQRLYVAKTY